MKQSKSHISIFAIFLFVTTFSLSCCNTSPNIRFFTKGQIRLEASLRTEEPGYYSLIIRDRNPNHCEVNLSNLSNVVIELPSGKIPLSKLTPDILFSQAYKLHPVSGPAYASENEKFFIIDVASKGIEYSFRASRKRIIKIQSAATSIFWNKSLTKRYTFPMSHGEAVELFGEPDKVTDSFFW